MSSTADIVIGGAMAGVGKMLHVDTKIPTPDGWKLNGDLREGDVIFSELGKQIKILVAHPIENVDGYKFIFDDGSTVVSCKNHLWKTLTNKDLAEVIKNNLGYNQSNSGSVKTAHEIFTTLRLKNGRANHAIPVCLPIETDEKRFEMDPYLLGLWLGDECSKDGSITTMNDQVVELFENGGFAATEWIGDDKSDKSYELRGFTAKLANLAVQNDKHIPSEYLRGSVNERIELIRGLMDSSGNTGKINEFISTNRSITQGLAELLRSLGIKTQIKEKDIICQHGYLCKAYSLSFATYLQLFKLESKRHRQRYSDRRTTNYRYIVDAYPVYHQPMRCITVDNSTGMYLCTRHFIPTHNSWCLLAEPLRHQRVKGFDCIIFRRTFAEIKNPGGLWSKSEGVYPYFGFRPNQSSLEWYRKDTNTTIKFSHLQYEKNVRDHDGAEYCLICFDELQSFSKKQFLYLLSRNRSTCGVRPYIRATCNPDPDSFLAELLGWWIDQDEKLADGSHNPNWGYPIKDRVGVVRFFVVHEDKFVWASTKDQLIAENPNIFTEQLIANTGDPRNLCKSLTLVTGSIFDNKELLSKDPSYLSNLMAQEESDRQRLLMGNWKVKIADNCIFSPQAIVNMFDNQFVGASEDAYITCDAARFGDDLCTVFIWRGWRIVKLVVLTKSSANDIVDAIERERNLFHVKRAHVVVDQDGVGGGVVKLGRYTGFSGNDPVFEDPGTHIRENYANRKAQFAYRFAEHVNAEDVSVALSYENIYVDGSIGAKVKLPTGVVADVRELIRQDFKAIRHKDKDRDGKKKINSKEEQKALLHGRSPDFFDGMFLRVWFDFRNGSGIVTGISKKRKSLLDYIKSD